MPRIFQKLPLVIVALTTLLCLGGEVLAAKKKISETKNPFIKGLGVIFNTDIAEFDKDINQHDKLMFLYVLDSKGDKSSQMTD